jgi:D-alanine-D-alanine ligase
MDKPFMGKRIGVLMGGISGEREISLRSGKGVLESLQKQGYDAVGIDVGADVDIKLRQEKVEVAYIILHGIGGEDGTIQGLLETMRIPYTGSGVRASALAMDKELTKLVIGQFGIPFAKTVYLDCSRGAECASIEIAEKIGLPAIVKPTAEGSSLGIFVAHDEKELDGGLDEFFANYKRGVAEAFISGKEITVGVIGAGEKIRTLPALELVPKNEYYDFEAKYTKGMTDFFCPARLDKETAALASKYAIGTHLALGCHGVSRVDFIVDKKGSLHCLELNSIPGMTPTSDLPEEIKAEGGTYDSLVLEILSSATCDR